MEKKVFFNIEVYPIEELANSSSHLEVCYLLMHGELPSESDKNEFEEIIKNHTLLNEQIIQFIGVLEEMRTQWR